MLGFEKLIVDKMRDHFAKCEILSCIRTDLAIRKLYSKTKVHWSDCMMRGEWILYAAVITIIVMATIISSCGPSITPKPTPTCGCQKVPQVPRVTKCPSATAPVVKIERPRFFYILIDNSGSYKNQRDTAIKYLQSALKNGLRGGDRIIIALIGTNPYDQDHIVMPITEIPLLPPPNLTNDPPLTPTVMKIECFLTPTLTPVPTGDAPSGKIKHNNELQKIANCNKQISIAATESSKTAVAYQETIASCDYYHWTQSSIKNIKKWRKEQETERLRGIEKINTQLANLLETEANEKYTDIYKSLYVASDVMQKPVSTGEFERVVLIIFSDGKATAHEPSDLPFEFNKMEVVMMMTPYDLDNPQRLHSWQQWFQEHGAASFENYSIFQSSEKRLTTILKR